MLFKRNKRETQRETKIVVDEVPMPKGVFNLYASVGALEFLATAFTIGYALVTLDVIGAIVLGIVTNIGINLLLGGCVLIETVADNFSASSRERKRIIQYGMDKEMINETHITAAVFSVAVDSMAKNPRYANTDFDFVRKMAHVASGLEPQESLQQPQQDSEIMTQEEIQEAVADIPDNNQETESTNAVKGTKIKYDLAYLEDSFGLLDDKGDLIMKVSYDKIKQVETEEDLKVVPSEDCYGYFQTKEFDLFFYTDIQAVLKVMK